MLRILNETSHRLTNRIVPITAKRGNGYGPSPSVPPLQFETTPWLFATEIDEHYFGIKPRQFDPVDLLLVYLFSQTIHDRKFSKPNTSSHILRRL